MIGIPASIAAVKRKIRRIREIVNHIVKRVKRPIDIRIVKF